MTMETMMKMVTEVTRMMITIVEKPEPQMVRAGKGTSVTGLSVFFKVVTTCVISVSYHC